MNECEFSPDRKHRYTLVHRWDELQPERRVMWIGLNPSTADEQQLDPTLRRIKAFSTAWGYNCFVMTNLFAFRATLPSDMKRAEDPVGRLNNFTLAAMADGCELIVAAWGAHGSFQFREDFVSALLSRRDLHCLGQNSDGSPRHPLYMAASTPLEIYQKGLV